MPGFFTGALPGFHPADAKADHALYDLAKLPFSQRIPIRSQPKPLATQAESVMVMAR